VIHVFLIDVLSISSHRHETSSTQEIIEFVKEFQVRDGGADLDAVAAQQVEDTHAAAMSELSTQYYDELVQIMVQAASILRLNALLHLCTVEAQNCLQTACVFDLLSDMIVHARNGFCRCDIMCFAVTRRNGTTTGLC